MNDNGKLQEDSRICSPVQQPVQPMIVNNYYGLASVEKPVEPELEESPAFGVKIFLILLMLAGVWWICWGWELFK